MFNINESYVEHILFRVQHVCNSIQEKERNVREAVRLKHYKQIEVPVSLHGSEILTLLYRHINARGNKITMKTSCIYFS
jgi:hypothetical protein